MTFSKNLSTELQLLANKQITVLKSNLFRKSQFLNGTPQDQLAMCIHLTNTEKNLKIYIPDAK